MKLDVAIPHTLEIPALSQPWELALGHKKVMGAMKLADELGFRKCMLGEHFLIPEDHLAASGAYWHHGTVFLAGVAVATAQIGIASSINILLLQHAVVQATPWSTLDWLSGGRATSVVAVGWLQDSSYVPRVPFPARGALTHD